MSEQTIQIVDTRSNGIGTAGFVLALLTLFFGWIPFIGWVMWLLGLIFSAMGISKAKKVNKGMGLSVAGLIISLIGVIMVFIIAGTLATIIGLSV
ncbi:hypothetical protein EV201_0111 [Ancylomarina subtilis]|uniref:DUF4190 domain-containing protein n=1 Tax=Ancylomarina subtilis TaxID=1639035 RepID=A0A4Q7VHD7_9BACT|nr:hypothetical protein [Ancylomarina subtilis]RZT95491.1 hypothetical protein EV201_0111 [Ancylomarina subtilis]